MGQKFCGQQSALPVIPRFFRGNSVKGHPGGHCIHKNCRPSSFQSNRPNCISSATGFPNPLSRVRTGCRKTRTFRSHLTWIDFFDRISRSFRPFVFHGLHNTVEPLTAYRAERGPIRDSVLSRKLGAHLEFAEFPLKARNKNANTNRWFFQV